jgi:NAD+ synthase (glutamine-hydrolysing)
MTPTHSIRIAGAALNQTPFDWLHNRHNIREAIREAQAKQVKILCLPELAITGYGCEDVFLSEWLPQKALKELWSLVPFCTGLTVCVGLPVRQGGQLYNCVCVIEDGKILGFTAKQFLANDGVHYEPRWFAPWPAGVRQTLLVDGQQYPFGDVLYDTQGIRIGFEICEDAWHAERPGIRHREQGVQLILNPSASHFAFGKSATRYDLVVGGSASFDCTYLYANLLGNEAGRMIYDGEILIAHKGTLVQRNKRFSFHHFNLVTADLNFDTGIQEAAPLTDDSQLREEEFGAALALALFDYMRKSRSKGFVLSLSGGADSSACAVLVSEMVKRGIRELGLKSFAEKSNQQTLLLSDLSETISEEKQLQHIVSKLLTCVYQGTVNSGQATFLSAQALAQSIGATFYHWQIEDEVKSYTQKIETALERKLSWQTDDLALQNIQARSRSPIIWMLANINQALLLTTSNRSEGDVGYATMDGDTSGSIAPIAGADKHFIRHWLRWAQAHLGQQGLQHVNALTPTAELRPPSSTQTDETDLMPYDILAQIERLAIFERQAPVEVFGQLCQTRTEDKQQLRLYVKKFFQLWSRNQWKRERIAPSFHVDEFNVDPRSWCRFPILSGGFEEELNELNKLEIK